MTSTEFTVGLEGTRASSKVLRPPGGGSSDIFGMESNQTANGSKTEGGDSSSTQNRLFGGGDPTFTPGRRQIKTNMFAHQTPLGPTPSRKPHEEGETATSEEVPPPKPVVTSIRVRNPPGGKSSGIF